MSKAKNQLSIQKNLSLLNQKISVISRNNQAVRQEKDLSDMKQEYYDTVEKKRLLKEGKNPYAVFRMRNLEKQQQKNNQLERKRLQQEKLKLKAQLLQDAKYDRIKRRQEEKQRLMQKRHLASNSTRGRMEKIKKYMRSVTITNTDIIDPCGKKLFFYPSQHVNF